MGDARSASHEAVARCSWRFASFEEINLGAIEIVRKGRIGEPKCFNSSFSMTVREHNIRTDRELGGGTLYDIGVLHCINAARHLFRAEPTEVMALSVNSGGGKTRRDRRVERRDLEIRA
jgi:predicted dehydrogenase